MNFLPAKIDHRNRALFEFEDELHNLEVGVAALNRAINRAFAKFKYCQSSGDREGRCQATMQLQQLRIKRTMAANELARANERHRYLISQIESDQRADTL